MQRHPALLLAGGLDPLGGAGITADATLAATLGVAPLPVALAIVEQDSLGVRRLLPLHPDQFAGSLRAALADGRPRVIKLGVIGSLEAAHWLQAELLPWLGDHPERLLVLDPILRGGTNAGAALAVDSMLPSLRALLTPQTILTPNLLELASLTGEAAAASDPGAAMAAALRLHTDTGASILLKSGHSPEPGRDRWVASGAISALPVHPRWNHDLHGTGCFVATALAVGIAQGLPPAAAAAESTSMLARLVAEGGVLQVGAGRPQLRHAQARW